MLVIRAALFALLLGAAAQAMAQDAHDATRLEVGERYCFHDERCLAAVRRDVAAGRSIQWVIYTLLQTTYADSPENAERAYESATRAITFATDFLSDAEWGVGQTTYVGANLLTLRQILARYAVACDNKIQWLPKYHCINRALFPLLHGQYRPDWVPIEQMPWK